MAKKSKTQFVCQACGYISPRYLGKCPNCGAWNEMVEEVIQLTSGASLTSSNLSGSKVEPQLIGDISLSKTARVQTDLKEFNRVLGGGVVPGSLVLIGGDPGIGKSTLLLQVSDQLSENSNDVLYVTGEESAEQIKLRAERLGMIHSGFLVYPEINIGAIRQTIEEKLPKFVIIDSIQTMVHPEITSAAGSVSQVREVTAELMRIAKLNQIAIFIVGHVTKEGSIAGPRMLEHMVDTVLYFEGDRHHSFRILRAVKNRFGSTNEIGIFEMKSEGLVEVNNPSEAFLEERLEGSTGSSIVVSLEGSRPILAEIQALVTPTLFGTARRTTTGLDYNRVALIMAVLEKRAGLLLQNQDAFLKATGGLKLDEPAIDLAIAISIASSYRDKGTAATECFVGEIGLTGEIRRVSRIDDRIKEAEKLGYKKIYIPKNNHSSFVNSHSIEVIGVSTIDEAIKKVFK